MIATVDNTEKRGRIAALSVTLLIHGLILLFLLIFVIHTPVPPFPESGSPGIEVNFGYSDEGSGNILTENQPASPAAPARASVKAHVKISSDKTEAKVVTANNGETTNLTNSEPNTSTNTVKTQEVSNELMTALARLRKKRESGNDGITNTPGNQGDPNGSNNTNNYAGTPGTGNEPGDGGGKGTRWSLRGRKMLVKPSLVDDSQEEGIVVVEIKVDKAGNVVYANPGVRGSTTSSAVLFSKARQAALKAKFNPSPEGVEEQKGTISFNFILN